jgi:hypothetical protein
MVVGSQQRFQTGAQGRIARAGLVEVRGARLASQSSRRLEEGFFA